MGGSWLKAASPVAHAWAPWQSPKVVSRICVPLIHSIPSQTVHSQVMHFTIQYSRWDEKEMGLSASVSHSWGRRMLNHTQSEITSWISLGPELCHLGGGVTKVKWTCSFNGFNGSNLGCYLLQQYASTSMDSPDFHKSILVCEWLSKSMFFERRMVENARYCHFDHITSH